MHISIRRYTQVRSVSDVCRKIAESFVPLLRRSPGFIAYYAIDAGGGTMATVSIFSTAAMALEFERQGGGLAQGERRGPAADAGRDHVRRGQGRHHGVNRPAIVAAVAAKSSAAGYRAGSSASGAAGSRQSSSTRRASWLPEAAEFSSQLARSLSSVLARRSPFLAASWYQRMASAGLAVLRVAATLRGSNVCAIRAAAVALPRS